jgi:hypothetical protein
LRKSSALRIRVPKAWITSHVAIFIHWLDAGRIARFDKLFDDTIVMSKETS